MGKLHFAVIDDSLETLAHIEILASGFNDLELDGIFSDPYQFLRFCKDHHPDFALLDIEMPLINGLKLADQLHAIGIPFAFMSNYSQFGIEAFQANALHYLHKPVSEEQLREVINRVSNFYSHRRPRPMVAATENTFEDSQIISSHSTRRILINALTEIVIVDTCDILYFGSDINYTNIFMADGRKIVSSKTLKTFEDIIEGHPDFLRVHRSAIVNRRYVRRLLKDKITYMLELHGGAQVQLAANRKDEILSWLQY